MAKININKGQPAPLSKHTNENEAVATARLVGAVVMSTFWFAVIWVCAVGLGFLIDWTDTTCEFVSDWMIFTGHAVEAMLYVADTVLLVKSVGKHLYEHLKGDWNAMRRSHAIKQ